MGAVGHIGAETAALNQRRIGEDFLPRRACPQGHEVPFTTEEALFVKTDVIVAAAAVKVFGKGRAVLGHHVAVCREVTRGEDDGLSRNELDKPARFVFRDDAADASHRRIFDELPPPGPVGDFSAPGEVILFKGSQRNVDSGAGKCGLIVKSGFPRAGLWLWGSQSFPFQGCLNAVGFQHIDEPVHRLFAFVIEGTIFAGQPERNRPRIPKEEVCGVKPGSPAAPSCCRRRTPIRHGLRAGPAVTLWSRCLLPRRRGRYTDRTSLA